MLTGVSLNSWAGSGYPAAQFPNPDPPLLVHSLEVKQVPFKLELQGKGFLFVTILKCLKF